MRFDLWYFELSSSFRVAQDIGSLMPLIALSTDRMAAADYSGVFHVDKQYNSTVGGLSSVQTVASFPRSLQG